MKALVKFLISLIVITNMAYFYFLYLDAISSNRIRAGFKQLIPPKHRKIYTVIERNDSPSHVYF